MIYISLGCAPAADPSLVLGGSSLDLLTCASTGSFVELLAGAGARFWCCWRPLRLLWALLAAVGPPFGRSWRLLGLISGALGPQESPKRGQKCSRKAPRGPEAPQEGTKEAPGPPKRPPKEPPEALHNPSAQKYRKTRCFVLENSVFARFGCISRAISSAKPTFFCAPRAQTPCFTRPEGAQKAKNSKICIFAGRAAVRDVSRFLGGRGLAKSRKIAFSRGRCCKNNENHDFRDPPRPLKKQLRGLNG